MTRNTAVSIAIGFGLIALLMAQGIATAGQSGVGPVISRSAPKTLKGEILEISCYKEKGVAGSTGASHVLCAKDCVSKGGSLGILTDGDGLFKVVGELEKSKYAKLVDYIGKTVELTGTEVVVSNNYDIKLFDAQKVALPKK